MTKTATAKAAGPSTSVSGASPQAGQDPTPDPRAEAQADATKTAAAPPETPGGRNALAGSGSLRAWVLAMRLRTLPAAAVPVLVGSALAAALGAVRLWEAGLALFGALMIQIGTNFANDVFDAERGADGPNRLGPTRAVAAGLISPAWMKGGIALVFGLASLAGVGLYLSAGWPVLAIGVASLLAGLAYTGGPFPLAYHGLGDIFVLIFFGFVAVGGTVYVQLGSLPAAVWPLALGVGALATTLLVVNNLRDVDEDRSNNKRTLAVRLGRHGTLLEHASLLLLTLGSILALALLVHPLMALALLEAPLFFRTHSALRMARSGPDFNLQLAHAGRLLVIHGLFVSSLLVIQSLLVVGGPAAAARIAAF